MFMPLAHHTHARARAHTHTHKHMANNGVFTSAALLVEEHGPTFSLSVFTARPQMRALATALDSPVKRSAVESDLALSVDGVRVAFD